MLDYKKTYHVIEEEDEDIFLPKLSFKTIEEAREFVKFCPNPNLLIVKTKDLRNYFLETETSKQF